MAVMVAVIMAVITVPVFSVAVIRAVISVGMIGVWMILLVGVVTLVLVHADAMVVVAAVMALLGHHLVAFEQAHAQQQGQGHFPLHRTQDAGFAFDRFQLGLQLDEPGFLHQVALVQQDHVAVDDLGAGHLAFEHLLAEVLGIHQGDDRVEAGEIAQITAQEGHRHRQGIGQARGFHHQIVHFFRPLQDPVDGLQQLAVDRAADAAIAQLHHVFAGGHHQLVVDADLAELIHQHGRFEALLIGEDVVQQGGLTGSEEAGQDRHRQGGVDGIHHGRRGGGGKAAGAGAGGGHAGQGRWRGRRQAMRAGGSGTRVGSARR